MPDIKNTNKMSGLYFTQEVIFCMKKTKPFLHYDIMTIKKMFFPDEPFSLDTINSFN